VQPLYRSGVVSVRLWVRCSCRSCEHERNDDGMGVLGKRFARFYTV
jgi:hypothetical protein